MVLAEGAAQVAAEAAHGQNHTAAVEPPQRLFLDGVQSEARHLAVVEGQDCPAAVDAGAAKARLPLFQRATVEAQLTALFHLCRTTSKRSSEYLSPMLMPPFCRAMSICCSTVSTPSRSGSSSPRREPQETMTP